MKWSKYIPHKPTPKQIAFLSLPHLEAFYGGAAGGGKSDALLMAALQYVDQSDYSAIIFRRTYADMKLPSSILNRAKQWLAPFLATREVRYRPSDNHTFYFPSGAQLAFGYMGTEGIEARYQSSEYQYCTAKGTKVLMEDGTYEEVQNLRVGDQVQTLEGPRAITRLHGPRRKFCVKIRGQVQGYDHKLLTPSGDWVSYEKAVYQAVLKSKKWNDGYKFYESSKELYQEYQQPFSYSSSGLQPSLLSDRPNLEDSFLQELFASLKDGQNDSSKYHDLSAILQQLPKLSFPVMLHEPACQLKVSPSLEHVAPNALPQLVSVDSRYGCPIEHDLHGGHETPQIYTDLSHLPSLKYAEELYHHTYEDDKKAPFLSNNENYQYEYSHPYTTEDRPLVETISPHLDTIEPFGFSEVYDITIDTASNYITESKLCQVNCAFDELTHFNEHEYTYLFSRLRRLIGSKVPLRQRGASNPGGRGMRWVRDRFQIVKAENSDRYIGKNPDAPFIPASILDNPYIDPEYLVTLEKLPKIERERLKYGNWDIAEDAIFNSVWFADRWVKRGPYYNVVTVDGNKTCHEGNLLKFSTVDVAASVKTGVNKQVFYKDRMPSWSVIATWGLTPTGELLWLDNVRFQAPIPVVVDKIYTNHKIHHPLFTRIEANGVGKGVFDLCQRKGLPIRGIHTQYDKIINSTAAQLRAEANKVWLPSFAPWIKPLEDELYMWTGHPDDTDDQIDVLSSAANEASERAVGIERDFDFQSANHLEAPINTGGLFHGKRWKRNSSYIGSNALRL